MELYALAAGLVRDDVTAQVRTAVKRRIVVAQSLYALGVLLCVISTYWSIVFIVVLQLNYAFGLRWPGFLEH